MLNTNSTSASQSFEDALEMPWNNVSDIVASCMPFFHDSWKKLQAGFGLLRELYRIAAGNRVKPDVLEILSQYEFNKDHCFAPQEGINYIAKHLNEVFPLIMSSFFLPTPLDGFVQPQEVTDLMCRLASFPENVTVYNPFAGANSYAIKLPNRVVGEELNATVWAIGQILLFANGAEKRADISLGNSFESMKSDEKYSAIIASPVYLHDEGKEISDIVKMLYGKLADGGKLACIVPANFLFSTHNKVRLFREKLINEKAIASVIMLPTNIFKGTSAEQAAIVLTKGVDNPEIHFGDASGHTRFANNIYRDTILDLESFIDTFYNDIADSQEGYDPRDGQTGVAIPYADLIGSELRPSLYLTEKPENGIPLSRFVEETPELQGKDIAADYFITGSSIPAAMHHKPFDPTTVESGKESTAKTLIQVPESAVILAIVNSDIRTVYTEGFTGKIAFNSGFIKVLKPKYNNINAKYLAAVLSTKIVADQIKAQTLGTTIHRLNKLYLDHIIIPISAEPKEREQVIADVISSEIGNLERKLQDTLDSQKREVRSTRHAMIQTLSALSSSWEQLKLFSELHKEGIKPNDTIGRINPISVKDLMGSIGHTISTLERQVEDLRLEKPDWGEEIEINPYKFINDYIANNTSPSVKMEVKHHNTDAPMIFYAPERLLERIFNNIVANAKSHGFTSDSKNNEIRFDWKSEDGRIVITIANNGLPLKQGVSGKDVLMRGFSTALNKDAADGTLHSGQGGFEIKSLMEGLGKVEVISQPEAEFKVMYKLTFEKTNSETIGLSED